MGLVQFHLQAPGAMGGSRGRARAEAAIIAELNPWAGYLAWTLVHDADRDTAAYARVQRDAIVAFPDSIAPYLNLSLLQQRRRGYDLAFETLESYLALHPGRASALYQVGRLAALSGERLERGEAALREYEAALELDPEFKEARQSLRKLG